MYTFAKLNCFNNLFHGIYLKAPKLHHPIIKATQVHSNKINIIKSSTQIIPASDGFITNKPNINLLIKTADCIPIFFYDRKTHSIGLVHAGWRGLIGKIHIKAITLMQSTYNANPKDIFVGIGPSICKKCYHFKQKPEQQRDPDWKPFISQKNKNYHIDLQGFVSRSLINNHISKNNIYTISKCTSCDKSLPSHKAKKPGRLYSVLRLKS